MEVRRSRPLQGEAFRRSRIRGGCIATRLGLVGLLLVGVVACTSGRGDSASVSTSPGPSHLAASAASRTIPGRSGPTSSGPGSSTLTCPAGFDLRSYVVAHFHFDQVINEDTSADDSSCSVGGATNPHSDSGTGATYSIFRFEPNDWQAWENDLTNSIAKGYSGQRGHILLGPVTGIYDTKHGPTVGFPAPQSQGAIVYSIIGASSLAETEALAKAVAVTVYAAAASPTAPRVAPVPTPTPSADPSHTDNLTCPARFDLKGAVTSLFSVEEVTSIDLVPGASRDDSGRPVPDDYGCSITATKDGDLAVIATLQHDRNLSWSEARQQWTKFTVSGTFDNKGTLPLGPVDAVFTSSLTSGTDIVFPAPPSDTGTYSLQYTIGNADSMLALANQFAVAAYSSGDAGLQSTGETSSPATPSTGARPEVVKVNCRQNGAVIITYRNDRQRLTTDPAYARTIVDMWPGSKLGEWTGDQCSTTQVGMFVFYGPYRSDDEAWKAHRDGRMANVLVTSLDGDKRDPEAGGLCQLRDSSGPPPVLSIGDSAGQKVDWIYEASNALPNAAAAFRSMTVMDQDLVDIVRGYQRNSGLPATGTIGMATWEALFHTAGCTNTTATSATTASASADAIYAYPRSFDPTTGILIYDEVQFFRDNAAKAACAQDGVAPSDSWCIDYYIRNVNPQLRQAHVSGTTKFFTMSGTQAVAADRASFDEYIANEGKERLFTFSLNADGLITSIEPVFTP